MLLAAGDHRVAGVVAALRADDHVDGVGEQVDDLALAFIAPLAAHQNCDAHRGGKRTGRLGLRGDAVATSSGALYRLGFGALVLVAIIVQMVSLGQSGVLDPLHYLTFFTNLSNEIAAIVFLVGAARWRSDRSHAFDLVRGGAVVYMTITGAGLRGPAAWSRCRRSNPLGQRRGPRALPHRRDGRLARRPARGAPHTQAGNPVAGLPGCDGLPTR